jgi:O-antigen/teichoic acid export membrane protein
MASPTVTKRQVLSGFGWQAVSLYTNRLVGLATTLILAKLLVPEQFGVVTIASMIIEVLQLLKDMGLSEALIYQKRDDHVLIDTAHTILVGFNAVLFLLASAIAPFAAHYYHNPILLPVIIVLSSNLVWDSLRAVPRTLVRRNIDFGKLVIPEIVPVATSCVISIVMALTGFGVWSLVAKTVVHSLLGFVLLRQILPYRPHFRYDREAARELFKYGKFIVGTTMLLVLLYNVDRFLVSAVLGVAAVGVFDLAMRISDLPVKQFSHMMGTVMFPVFSKIERSGEGVGRAFLKTLRYVALVSTPVAIGISVFGPALILRVYGARWAGLVVPLGWLALYAMFRSLSSIIGDALKATGHPMVVMRVSLFKLLSIGGLGVPVLWRYGVLGMCLLIVGTYALALIWELHQVTRVTKTSMADTATRLAVLMGGTYALMYGAYLGLERLGLTRTVPQLVAGSVVTGAAYVGIIALVDREAVRDLKSLRRPRLAPTAASS